MGQAFFQLVVLRRRVLRSEVVASGPAEMGKKVFFSHHGGRSRQEGAAQMGQAGATEVGKASAIEVGKAGAVKMGEAGGRRVSQCSDGTYG